MSKRNWKPCPFKHTRLYYVSDLVKADPDCFSEDGVEYCTTNRRAHWMECVHCGAKGPSRRSKSAAVRAWNRREETGHE
jgi:hypothetical protein